MLVSLLVCTALSGALWFATYWDDIWSNHDVPWRFEELYSYAVLALVITLPDASIPLTINWARHR